MGFSFMDTSAPGEPPRFDKFPLSKFRKSIGFENYHDPEIDLP